MTENVKGDWNICNNLRARNFSLQTACVPTSNSILALDRAATSNIIFTGDALGQILDLPDATDCLEPGHQFCIFNDSSEIVTVRDFESNVLIEVLPGASCCFILKDNSTPGGVWTSGRAQLSKVLIDTTNVSGVSGNNAQDFIFDYISQVGIPVKNETAEGETNCKNLIYNTKCEFIEGSLEVFIDGVKLDHGIEYVENVDKNGFSLILGNDDPLDSNRMKTPPSDNEKIMVSYCRRIIF